MPREAEPVVPVCKDCKFYNGLGGCHHPRNREVSLVTGNAERQHTCAYLRLGGWFAARFMDRLCGREGRWFQQKEDAR